MDSLYSFAVSDDIKYLLYKNFDMRDVLRKIIYNGNKDERESAFKLLYQLCFDYDISTDIKQDTKLYDLIQLYPDMGSSQESILNSLNKYKAVVDYVDTSEEESSLIAINPDDQKKINTIHILKLTRLLY